MWNPDVVYQAEMARRAELYAQGETERAARIGTSAPTFTVRLGRALKWIGERLEGAEQGHLRRQPHS